MAAAQAPAYYPPAPAPRTYYPPQANAAPAYGAPPAYYPAPAASPSYAPPPRSHSYAPRPFYDEPRYPQYGDFDDYRGPASNHGYYRQDGPPSRGGYYAPRPSPYAAPYADSYSFSSPNQR